MTDKMKDKVTKIDLNEVSLNDVKASLQSFVNDKSENVSYIKITCNLGDCNVSFTCKLADKKLFEYKIKEVLDN